MAVLKCISQSNGSLDLLDSYTQNTSTVLTNRVQAMSKYSNESRGSLNQTLSQKDWWLMTRDGWPKRGSKETGV